MCLSFYLILNTSEAKIYFPSLCFDFQNSYCLKKMGQYEITTEKASGNSSKNRLYLTDLLSLTLCTDLSGAETTTVTGNRALL